MRYLYSLRSGGLLGALATLMSCGVPAEPAAVRAHVVVAGACALDTSADQLAEPAPIDVDGLLSVVESGECAARTYAAAQDTPAASFQERCAAAGGVVIGACPIFTAAAAGVCGAAAQLRCVRPTYSGGGGGGGKVQNLVFLIGGSGAHGYP